MPPISDAQLLVQYRRARQHAGDLIDRIEDEFRFPPFLMYAIGSRETNFDPRYLREPGDQGNGHGWWQIDKRYHHIPADWRSNIAWQCRRGAEVLRGAFTKCGSWQGACSAYNSGSCEDRFTTGKDYGRDVMDRRARLERLVGPRQPPEPEPPPRRKAPDMFLMGIDPDGMYLVLGDGRRLGIPDQAIVDQLQGAGVPNVGVFKGAAAEWARRIPEAK